MYNKNIPIFLYLSLIASTLCGKNKNCKSAQPTVMGGQPLSLEIERPTSPKYDKNEVAPACMLNKPTQ